MPQPALAAVDPQTQINEVEAWLKAHSHNMYTCPLLPGQPKVTRQACLKRRSLALEISNRNGNESFFDGGGPVGITICLNCRVGDDLQGEKVA
ncbi:MAG: hypothetical protein JRJ59_06360 [Deltaproteobacteria bacterium]|nr:hypothetical protein [Deltaproteobacteria bacterium]